MRTILWTGPDDWTDTVCIEYAIQGLRRPFRSIVGREPFASLCWEVLAAYRLPRLCYDDRLESNLHRLSRMDSDGFLILAGTSPCPKSYSDLLTVLNIDLWRIN